MAIPSKIAETLLPKNDLNVVDLCHFSIPKDKDCPDLLSLSNKEIFSATASMVTDGYIAFLQSLPMPTTLQVEILQERLNDYKKEISVQSLSYCYRVSILRLPLWVLDYWMEANIILEQKQKWSPAIDWLKRRKEHEAIRLLTELPWKYQMPKSMGDHIADLAVLCSERWLGIAQVDTMLETLNDHLDSKRIPGTVKDVNFLRKLINIYRHSPDTYAYNATAEFIRKFAEKLKTGEVSVVGMAVAVHYKGNTTELPIGTEVISNHWCSLIINTNDRTLHYGDSLGPAPPHELLDVLNWWLGLSFPTPFSVVNLPITQQSDNISCGIFAVDALSHYFSPFLSPLTPNTLCLQVRSERLKDAVRLLKKRVGYFRLHNLNS